MAGDTTAGGLRPAAPRPAAPRPAAPRGRRGEVRTVADQLMQAPSRRDRVRAATSQEIVQTARRLLVEQGIAAVSLRAIAREMGMTAPALYRYYESHEELLRHLVAEIFTELADYLHAEIRAAARRFDLGAAPAAPKPGSGRASSRPTAGPGGAAAGPGGAAAGPGGAAAGPGGAAAGPGGAAASDRLAVQLI